MGFRVQVKSVDGIFVQVLKEFLQLPWPFTICIYPAMTVYIVLP